MKIVLREYTFLFQFYLFDIQRCIKSLMVILFCSHYCHFRHFLNIYDFSRIPDLTLCSNTLRTKEYITLYDFTNI